MSDIFLSYALHQTTIALGTNLMKDRFGYSEEETGIYIMLPYLVCAIMMVPIGNLADKIGQRQSLIIFGGFLQLIACIIFLVLPDSNRCYFSIIPWILLGLN